MQRTALATALASVLGFAATAAPASADDFTLDRFALRFDTGGRSSRGFVAVDFVARPPAPREPRVLAEPAPYAPWGRPGFPPPPVVEHRRWVPGYDVVVEDVVCEPAVYEDRCVPVYDTVEVPVYDEVVVPVFRTVRVPVTETRTVPLFERVVDPRTGRVRNVRVGERTETVVVGEREERVRAGERRERVVVGHRTERVQVSERHERVLVRAEVCRPVTRVEHVPGRFVTCVADRAHAGGFEGEVMTFEEYRAEVARASAPHASTHAPREAGRRGPGPAGARR
ncbi:MAG: hypothetical protein IT460_08585 [Planctomycetes bacterium]|nr:hypothetical protein [Planctomycetota bacterium]